jgi:hypothetical protein
MLTVERYRKTRFWAVYEAGELLCVTVYRKGAIAVKERLERQDIRVPDAESKAVAAPN